MTVLLGMVATAFVFVAYRFRRFKWSFWFHAVLGAIIWLLGVGFVQMITTIV